MAGKIAIPSLTYFYLEGLFVGFCPDGQKYGRFNWRSASGNRITIDIYNQGLAGRSRRRILLCPWSCVISFLRTPGFSEFGDFSITSGRVST